MTLTAYLAKMRMRPAVRGLFAAVEAQKFVRASAAIAQRWRDQSRALREHHYSGAIWDEFDIRALRQATGRPVINRIAPHRVSWPVAQWVRT